MMSFNHISRRYVSLICTAALIATALVHAVAQQPATAKRPLTHKDYDTWHSIQSPQISRDGKFVAYAYMAQEADSEIVVRNVAGGTEWRAARGFHPPLPPPDDPGAAPGEFQANQSRLIRPVFTADAHFVIFSIEPTRAELNKARKDKKRPDDMPKNALGIMDVSNGQVARVERVKSFQVPEDAGSFIAYSMEAKPSAAPNKQGADGAAPKENPTSPEELNEDDDAPQRPQGGGSRAGAAGRAPKNEYGTDLVIRNLTTGAERTISDVLDYSFSKDAKTLAYTVAAKNEETNGVYVLSPQSDAAPTALLAGKGKYQKLTWDDDQTELAFISDRDDQPSKQAKFKIYLWERGSATPVADRANSSSSGVRDAVNHHIANVP